MVNVQCMDADPCKIIPTRNDWKWFLQFKSIKMWSDYFSFNMRRHLPVNRNKGRNIINCSAFNSSSDTHQYVVVWLFLFVCVDRAVCKHKSMKKQLVLLSIPSFNCQLSICGGLILSPSVCGHVYLWIRINQETIGTV